MTKLKAAAAIMGLAGALAIGVACNNGEAATFAEPSDAGPPVLSATGLAPVPAPVAPAPRAVGPSTPDVPVPGPQVAAPPEPAVKTAEPAVIEPSISVPMPPREITSQPSFAPVVAARAAAAPPMLQTGNSQAGIWVTGEGTVTLEPDLAMLNIGVEATTRTVAEARDEAARAMDAIVAVLHARGIEDKDIKTRFFNISTRYEFREVFEEGLEPQYKQVLIGYMVSNSAVIKIRDLEAVGAIVDEVVTAGGDATRINGISFTVEDPKPLMVGLREAAVTDALAKAQQFASLTGVSLGRLVIISETGGRGQILPSFQEGARFAVAAAAPAPTAISGGELELRMTVQAIFDIL